MASTNSLQTSITGDRWWGGFTAEITLTNPSTQDLESWSYSFDSPHLINTAPWGAEISAVLLDNGLTRYTLKGEDWAQRIPAGGSVTIGFNGTQGTDLGNEGELSAAMLFGSDTPVAANSQTSEERLAIVRPGGESAGDASEVRSSTRAGGLAFVHFIAGL